MLIILILNHAINDGIINAKHHNKNTCYMIVSLTLNINIQYPIIQL